MSRVYEFELRLKLAQIDEHDLRAIIVELKSMNKEHNKFWYKFVFP